MITVEARSKPGTGLDTRPVNVGHPLTWATALLLALIARDDIGMPPDMIREDALLGVGLIIAALAGMSLRRRPQ